MNPGRKRGRYAAWAFMLALAVLVPLIASSAVEAAGPYDLRVSTSPNRSADVTLAGQTVTGNIYVFTSQSSTSDISKVEFFLDDPSMSGTPRQIEKTAPYDFAGTVSATIDPTLPAKPFDTTTVADGPHTITARITHTNLTQVVISATFTIQNTAPTTPKLSFSPSSLSFSGTAGGSPPAAKPSTLATSDGGVANFTITDDASWLTATPTTGSGSSTSISFTADPSSESAGTKTATVTATAPGYDPATMTVTLNVSPASTGGCQLAGGQQLSPLSCDQVLVTMPYTLGFSSDAGKIVDKNGVGTGFTMVLPTTKGTGYIPANLTVNTASPGTLGIKTTAGLFQGAAGSTTAGNNAQDNALGVGVKPGKAVLMKTTLLNVPLATGKLEQAGLYFGNDENNYVKLIVRSSKNATTNATELKIQLLMEVAGSTPTGGSFLTGVLPVSGANVGLSLTADPVSQKVTGSYTINSGSPVTVGTVTAPPAFFTNDAAGVDPTIGTNTFGGVFASHRNATSSLTYSFDGFSLEDVTAPPPPPPGNFNFNRFSIGGTFANPPTAMAFGPDGKLYVTELLGRIHKMTIDPSTHKVTNDQVITTMGNRLTLGIAIDPASTASNVIVWVAHSDPDLAGPDPTTGLGGAPANSGAISKLTGASLGTKTDVITGLPRSRANHATNEIHFGPDGKLYIAQGGNTGAGAPNSSSASLGEFGWREEQPLSAAILVADVMAAGFDGTCDNTGVSSYTFHGEAIYGANPCSVGVYATGFRNAYDFAWHSNGTMYAPNNGESVGPTYPKSPTPPCNGESPTSNDPGTQDDYLMRVTQGKYYGHPDPNRINPNGPECVYKDGHWQGVAPDPDFVAPIANVGAKASADGTIEYKGSAFSGALNGNLLITRYSQGDDILRVCLSADGTSVVGQESLATSFNDPLPIVEGSDGTIYVGEFGAAKITALVPTTGSGGCSGGGGGGGTVGTWTTKAPMPVAYLDPGGAELGGKLYLVGGKTKDPTTGSSVHQKTLYIYNPSTNSWTKGPNLPTAYAAVENPAVVSYNGKLYAFGGGTAAFSGAQTSAAVYNPSTNAWSMLAAMPVARAGAAAEVIGTKIYVAGGLASTGASLASMSIYDPATNTWSAGPAMATARDNPGSAALVGKLYVFGGRTRLSTGTTVNGTLTTGEVYDPGTNTWKAIASMPTGRRSMVVGALNGKAQVIGGERTSTGGTFAQNEEYDPATNTWRALTPMTQGRHGAAAGTINGVVYVAAGGTKGGSYYSTLNEAFTY